MDREAEDDGRRAPAPGREDPAAQSRPPVPEDPAAQRGQQVQRVRRDLSARDLHEAHDFPAVPVVLYPLAGLRDLKDHVLQPDPERRPSRPRPGLPLRQRSPEDP